jgi:O-antigen ligase
MAALVAGGAALLVLLIYAPGLQAPFLVPKFAALEIAASLGFMCLALRRGAPGGPRWTQAVSAGAFALLVSTAIAWLAVLPGSLGAPYAVDAIARWVSLFGIACGASVIADEREPRERVLQAATVAAAVVAFMGLLQHMELTPLSIPIISRPGSTFGNRNQAGDVMAMALPLGVGAVASARDRTTRAVAIAAVGLELVFLGVTRTRGAWIGAACGLGTTIWLARRHMSRSVILVVAAGGIAAVGAWLPGRLSPNEAGDTKRSAAVTDMLEQSIDPRSTAVRTRLGLWRRSAAMLRDHPVLGVGPGNWPVVFPLYAEPDAYRDGVLTASRAARQAHEDILERAAETGVVGLLALVALAAGTGVAVRRRSAADRETSLAASAAGGSLVALVGLALAAFPLEMPGTICLAGLALGLVAPRERAELAPAASRLRTSVTAIAALVLVVLAVLRAEQKVRGSFWLGEAERAMRRDRSIEGATEALQDLARSLAVDPRDYRAEFRTAQMKLRAHRPLDAWIAARRAIDIEPHAPNGWAVLAEAELDSGDPEAARRDATTALSLLQDYPFALDVRGRAAERVGDQAQASADRAHIAALASGPENDDTAREARAVAEP